MAENVEKPEDKITCPICLEIFREPVSLSCQHSFCRECLQVYTLQSRDDDVESSRGLGDVVSCPLCRKKVDLGVKGVPGLPVQLTLASIVEQRRWQHNVDKEILICSLCECEVNSSEQCDDHRQQGLEFCGSCQSLLCKQCFTDHEGHPRHDIESQYRKNLEFLEENISALAQFKAEVEEMIVSMDKFQANVEEKKALHVAEIEKAYNKAMETVNKWREDSLEAMEKRHQEWLLACTHTMEWLKFQTDEIESLIQLSKEQLTGARVRALMGHSELTIRYNDLSSTLQDNLPYQRDLLTKWRHEMKNDPVIPRKLFIRETHVSTPKLMFINSLSDGVCIRENGSTLLNVYSSRPGKFNGAMTDGRFQTGRHYWELDLTVTLKLIPKFRVWVYSAGIVKDVPDLWYVGACSQSSGVLVECRSNQYLYVCSRDHQEKTSRSPVFPEGGTTTRTVRQGFYLNCDQRTFTILDCTNNRVLHTFTDLDMAHPFTPAVSVHSYDEVDVSVTLRQGNLYTLFEVLPGHLCY